MGTPEKNNSPRRGEEMQRKILKCKHACGWSLLCVCEGGQAREVEGWKGAWGHSWGNLSWLSFTGHNILCFRSPVTTYLLSQLMCVWGIWEWLSQQLRLRVPGEVQSDVRWDCSPPKTWQGLEDPFVRWLSTRLASWSWLLPETLSSPHVVSPWSSLRVLHGGWLPSEKAIERPRRSVMPFSS